MKKHKLAPHHLPQMSMPIVTIIEKLNEENIDYEYDEVDSNELVPSQAFVTSDKVHDVKLDDMNPIWVDMDNKIVDGHHRMIKALSENKPIKVVRLKIPHNHACRVLNKIQDIYEYEESRKLEEVLAQDVINANNEMNSDDTFSEYLAKLEEDNSSIENMVGNKTTLVGYRNKPIMENSSVGNFFILNPIEGYDKYEIEFDNLLDTDSIGIEYKDSQSPIDILAKIWFPHINFEKVSEIYNVPSHNIKNKAILEKAKLHNFDGIKYGNKLLQGLK